MKPWRLLSLQLFPAGASHQDHRLWLAWPVLWRLLPGGIIVALFFLCGALSFLIESPPGLSLQHRPRFDLSPCSGTAAQTPPAINQDNGDDGLFRRQTERRVEAVPCPESPEHPLGTDREGQDILLSLWAGLKVYFPAVLLAPLLSLIIGVILGTLMGYPQPNSHVARTCHALSHSLASVPRLLAIVFVLGALGRLSDHGGYTPINVWTVLGVLYAQFMFFFDPDTVFSLAGISVRAALITIIGGMGAVAGPLIGAVLIVPIEELSNMLFSSTAAGLSQLVFGAVLIAVVIWQPRGLLALFRRRGDRK